jgi:hypothetical protein
MLKKEENANYRLTIRNTLEFNPQILKRFVNFMNNPDEEPAVIQFGKDGKYFGVCVLLSTMPGLPMFGHGQIEGFSEKYGMEYARALWEEHADQHLIERHEREIFPILKKRYLFSEVEHFYLYDFLAEGGHVDEDVYVYSNRAGAERALVVYHNKYKETRGVVRTSVGFMAGSGSIVIRTLAEALELSRAQGVFVIMEDHISGLEYLYRNDDIAERGLPLSLGGFEYRVLWRFREVVDSKRRPWTALEVELAGRGVASMEEAIVEHAYRAVHEPLFEAVNAGSTKYLLELAHALDPEGDDEIPPAVAFANAVEEKLRNLLDGLRWMVLKGIFSGEIAIDVDLELPVEVVTETAERIARVPGAPGVEAQMGIAWIFAGAAAELAKEVLPEERAESWRWSLPLLRAFKDSGVAEELARRTAELLELLLIKAPKSLAVALQDPAIKAYLEVHDHDGVTWFRKERFEELARAWSITHEEKKRILFSSSSSGPVEGSSAEKEADRALEIAEKSGYRFLELVKALAARSTE